MYFQHLLARQIQISVSAYRSHFYKMAMSNQPKGINAFTIGNKTYFVDVALSKDAV
jgi:hypothetical protein